MTACAIDFGTSNTTVVLADGGRLTSVAADPEGTPPEIVPTLLYFPADGGAFYGSAARRAYVETDMMGRFVQAVKRHLPSPTFHGTVIQGRVRSLEELVAGFLAWLRRAAMARVGHPVDAVLLGRPAAFSQDPERDRLAEARLRHAALLAGFREVEFQVEPVAAARAYEQSLQEPVLCLVGDLGGGTSDFTLMWLGPDRVGGDRRQDVVGSAGVALAGNDFDERLITATVLPAFGVEASYRIGERWMPIPTHLHRALTRWHLLSFACQDEASLEELDVWLRTCQPEHARGLGWLREVLDLNYGFSLFRAVEAAKVTLSTAEEAVVSFHEGSIHLDVPVTREAFELAARPVVAGIARCLDELLARTGVRPDDVGAVFVTGGTSRIPCVRRVLTDRFGHRLVEQDALQSVGWGLGVEAAERWG